MIQVEIKENNLQFLKEIEILSEEEMINSNYLIKDISNCKDLTIMLNNDNHKICLTVQKSLFVGSDKHLILGTFEA